jgi:hypothetical protein
MNRAVVDRLIARLHEAGHTTWLARRRIRLGEGRDTHPERTGPAAA